jgi:hypothetical protein
MVLSRVICICLKHITLLRTVLILIQISECSFLPKRFITYRIWNDYSESLFCIRSIFKGQGKPLDKAYIDDWYKKLNQFDESVFSKIADTFYEFDSLTRAALIILEANTQPLELKAASYCVAFEAVCHTIKKHFGIVSPTVIDTGVFNADVKPQFLSLLDQLERIQK